MTVEGKTRTLVVIVVHLKALTDRGSYLDRVDSAAALKDYLDRTYPTRWVLVLGDFNDDLFRSTRAGEPSPFAALVGDTARYRFLTEALSRAGEGTTLHFSSTIDHHLATDELAARAVGDAEVLHLERVIRDFGETTSDHLPVLSRYDLR
jgi:endonuclease/exonuclease/phosphatase family metal-dependent hydrolase